MNFTISSLFMDLTALLLEGKLLKLWLGYIHHRGAQISAIIQMLPPKILVARRVTYRKFHTEDSNFCM